MIQIRYGSYIFAAGLQTYTFDTMPSFSETFQRAGQTYRAEIRGALQVPSSVDESAAPAYLVDLITRLKNAFAIDGQDFVVTNSDGAVIDAIYTADIVGGLRVLEGPSFNEVGPGELVRKRSFRIVLGGERALFGEAGGGGVPVFVSYNSSLSMDGTGGPRFVLLETMEGKPIKQIVNRNTICRATQQGRAVQRYSQPSYPAPLFPDREQVSARNITFARPDSDSYEVSWSYQFESATPF